MRHERPSIQKIIVKRE